MTQDAPADRFDRRSGRAVEDPSHRIQTHRDRDRVLYSEAFRRLGGVTQVASGNAEMLLHTRLTHSLKVEQVGVSLFTRLEATSEGLTERADMWAVAAACLAHDIGHPPFGHAGEQELNKLVTCDEHRDNPRPLSARKKGVCENCTLEDGFEGNAQTFRILATLSVHKDSLKSNVPLGLDLTRATLRASTKYPWARGDNVDKLKKWGAYDCDVPILEDLTQGNHEQSLDAQIMDWADDISYAVHDIEDFYRTQYIPLDQLKKGEQALVEFLEYVESPSVLGKIEDDVKETLGELLAYFPNRRFAGRESDFAELDRARGTLLTRFIGGASVSGDQLIIDSMQKRLNQIVQQFIWYHVIDDPRLSNIQAGQRRVLSEIYHALVEPLEYTFRVGKEGSPDEKDLRRLPHALRRSVQVAIDQQADGMEAASYGLKQRVHRGLLDFISGLSDAEAYRQHAVLKGREPFGHLS